MIEHRSFTAFQQSTREQLLQLLDSCGMQHIAGVGGERETYVTVYVPSVDLRAWIYDDEAQFHIAGRQIIHERPDYASIDDLQRAFLANLKKFLVEKQQ